MAGTLPGLHADSARKKRRFSPDSAAHGWTRRALYTGSRGTYRASITSVQRSAMKQALEAEKETKIREARVCKERLDERLRTGKKLSAFTKQNGSTSLKLMRMVRTMVCYRF